MRTPFPRARGVRRPVRLVAPRVSAHPRVLAGKPVVAGTRIPVALVVGQVAGGATPAKVAGDYGITEQDVYAALSYAAAVLEKSAPASADAVAT